MSIPPIQPANLSAQLHYRAAGNPASTMPDSAISNCFPGLEFDFRNVWRRLLVGIELHEASGLVVSADPEHDALVDSDWYLLEVAGIPTRMEVSRPGGPVSLAFMEWSNALADVVATRTGELVECTFGNNPNGPLSTQNTQTAELRVRPLFVHSDAAQASTALIDEVVAQPGELTQSLCSPWQNDYRECGCFYWAASRPDYVNVEPTAEGASSGRNWMDRDAETREYQRDDPEAEDQIGYEDLFRDWEGLLRFIVGGRDSD